MWLQCSDTSLAILLLMRRQTSSSREPSHVEEGQRPAAPRAVIRAAGSRHGVLAALVRSLPCSLVAEEPAPRSRATPLSWDAESRSDTESTEANFHFPLAELRWPALGTAF